MSKTREARTKVLNDMFDCQNSDILQILQERIDILKAFDEDPESVEYCSAHYTNGEWRSFVETNAPCWDWECFNYRIKEEKVNRAKTQEAREKLFQLNKNIKERLYILNAFDEDPTSVQFYEKDYYDENDRWISFTSRDNPIWHWDKFKYRIKPAPVEAWVNVYENGIVSCGAYKSRSIAYDNRSATGYVRTVKLVEAEE